LEHPSTANGKPTARFTTQRDHGTLARMGITPQQFKQLQDRLGNPRRSAAPVLPGMATAPATMAKHALILGVDPSLRGTGYGIVHPGKPHPTAIVHGTIRCPAGWDRSRCLVQISQTLKDVIAQHRPTLCVIEGLFFAQNLQTALIMGEARGAALAAIAEAGLEIYELAARKVKQSIVGYGAAQKLAVAKMVQRMLHLAEPPASDAADALALALTHAQDHGRFSLKPPKRI
ncbi:MAG TPA: crossover junction endodeoxyribonuclease RuvC, partial [Clostridia bacterium]|nr:crossover junction endodeoxyribonuclease RuvC [Clostridia bacterium]